MIDEELPDSPPAEEQGTWHTETVTPDPDAGGDASPPPYWPEDWRSKFAGNDEKMAKHLNRFTSPEGIYKAWRNLDRQRNDGRLQPAKPDTDDPAQIAEWRKSVGLPETPQGYFEHLGRTVEEGEKAGLTRMFTRMHDLGVPPGQAKEVVEEYYRMSSELQAEADKRDATFRSESEEELRGEWGAEYKQNLQAISVMMQNYGDEPLFDRLNSARFADGTRLADDPMTMKFLASIAREVTPDGYMAFTPNTTGNNMQKLEDELQSLEREMQDAKGRDRDGYWRNESKQRRYIELLQVKEKLDKRRA